MSMESVWATPASVKEAYEKAAAARDALIVEFAAQRQKEKEARDAVVAQYKAQREEVEKEIAALKAKPAASRWDHSGRADVGIAISDAEMRKGELDFELLASALDDEGLPERPIKNAVERLKRLANMALISAGDLQLTQDQAAEVGGVLSGDFEQQWRMRFEHAYRGQA